MHTFIVLMLIPLAAGVAGYLVRRLRNELTFIGAILTLYYAARLFFQSRHAVVLYNPLDLGNLPVAFRLDAFSGFVLFFVSFFTVLVLLYSFRYMKGRSGTRGYYFYLLVSLAAANGVVLAANLVTLIFFWGVLLVMVYGLLLVGEGDLHRVAGKALVIIGLSDFALLLGVVILVVRGWFDLAPAVSMPLTDPVMVLAFLLVATGALAKAGAMPLHSWIPAAGETAPATVLAFIPASLDKLLGIYLLARLSLYMFNIGTCPVLRHVFMTVGAVTVLGAVMMALVQKRVMKLLSFHAVSQVGYMVLGIGTGVPVGIAGGLFHMLNNSLYKSALFLSAGSVEHWTRTDEIDKLGGLAKAMPITFVSFFVAALAIAGVPPLNGFASKWMVYQGIIETAREGSRVFPVYLVAAMLGSVLTLASFLKLLHSMFLGQRPAALARVREVGFGMWLPPALLAAVCVVFGIFAYPLPLAGLIYPSLPQPFIVELPGIWQPVLTTLLMLVGLGLGALVYVLGTGRQPVTGRTFVGGEPIADEEESRVTGTAFYSPVKHLPIIDELLKYGEMGAFDIYNWLRAACRALGVVVRRFVDDVLNRLAAYAGSLVEASGASLSRLMDGNLSMYVAWVFAGAVVFLLVLFLR